MQSVTAFRDLITRNWAPHDPDHISRVVDAFFTHALVCRAKVDAPSEGFRAFAARTCKMTRQDSKLYIFREQEDDEAEDIAERRAACEALHDLIMEGV